MSPKRNPERERAEFGKYLVSLREQRTGLGVAAAARRLGLQNRQRLDSYETGRTKPPVDVLIEMARLYQVTPDELLRATHWPQLVLLPLVSIVDPDQLSDDLIAKLEKGLAEAERRKITDFIENLLKQVPVK